MSARNNGILLAVGLTLCVGVLYAVIQLRGHDSRPEDNSPGPEFRATATPPTFKTPTPALEAPPAPRGAVPAEVSSGSSDPKSEPVEPSRVAKPGPLAEFRLLPEATLVEMHKKRDLEQAKLTELASPFLEQLFADNAVEHVSDGTSWTGGDTDKERSQIYWVRITPGKGVDRAVLPRWQHPDLYEIKGDLVRVTKLVHDTEHQQALSERK